MQHRILAACSLIVLVAASAPFQMNEGELDLADLLDYANQPVPDYITQDNTPADNPITDEGATLGRVLFYDVALSNGNSISCSTCHQQEFAFSDINQLSVGVGGNTERHSMRLVNIRFGEDSLFRWDRTAATLEDQVLIPIHHAEEMGYSGTGGQPDMQDLLGELAGVTYYPPLFELAFGSPEVTEERIARAVSQFLRSIQSFDSKYDIGRAQVAADLDPFPNFNGAENAGKTLFIEDFTFVTDVVEVEVVGGGLETFTVSRRTGGGLNCATCHRPPEFDIDPESLNNGFIRNAEVEPGEPLFDLEVSRSPTLRDLIQPDDGPLNGGMFHAGEAVTLFGMQIHYKFRQLQPANTNLDPRYTPGGLPQFLDMTQQESNQLNAFLHTLSGTAVYSDERWSNPFDADGNLTLLNIPVTGPTCPEDLNGDGIVTTSDMLDLLAAFGCTDGCGPADVNGDDLVTVSDVLAVLSFFGQNC